MQEAVNKTKVEHKAASKELDKLDNEGRADEKKRVALEAELEEVNSELREARDTRRESKKDEKMRECLESLKVPVCLPTPPTVFTCPPVTSMGGW